MSTQNLQLFTIGALMFAGSIDVGVADAASTSAIVVPDSANSLEGDDNNGFPFWPMGANPPSMRYQQVYGSAEFAASIPAGGLVTHIAFRAESQSPAFFFNVPSVQVNLSTTAATPDGLSATFAENVGLDDALVFGPAPLTISSAFGPSIGAKPFSIVIPLATPFAYRPAMGNLLVDFRTMGGSTDISLDAISVAGDSVGRQYSSVVDGGSNSLTAGTMSATLGLVTQFTVIAIPEPASAVLVSIGFAALFSLLRPKR